MKLIVSTILVILTCSLHAQLRKWEVELEIAPGFSDVTGPNFFTLENNGYQPSANMFLKGGYHLNEKLVATLGIGYLVTDQFERSVFNSDPNVDFTEVHSMHRYIVLPIGIKHYFGSFFVNPEIGIAFANGHEIETSEFRIEENNLSIEGSTVIHEGTHGIFNQTTFPLLLTFGTEFDVGAVSILLGFKGYFSLNDIGRSNNLRHYYGFGLMTGVKF